MPKKSALGLLIDDVHLEALELKPSKGKFSITNYVWSRLPPGTVKAGKVINSKILAAELKKLLQAGRTKSFKGLVVLGLPQSQVFLKVFTIPKFEEKELNEAISWHVDSLKPVLPQNAHTSYEVIEKKPNYDVKVLLAAVPQEVIDGYAQTAELADLKIDIIEPLALSKARLINPQRLLNKSIISVHLYQNQLSVSVLINTKLWFSKEIFIPSGEENNIRSAVSELIKFFTEKKNKDIVNASEIIYSGDNHGLDRLKTSLVGFKLPVVQAQAGVMLIKSQAVSDVQSTSFTPVLGLAVRGNLHQKGLINLLPEWPKAKAEILKLIVNLSKAIVVAGIIAWLNIMVLEVLWWQFSNKKQNLSEQIAKLEVQLNEQKEKELLTWGKQFNQTTKTAQLIEKSKIDYTQVFARLSASLPLTVKLTSFKYQPFVGKWSIIGIADKREDVLVLDKALKESQFFSDARLYFSSLESNQGVVFRFSGGKL